MKRTWHLLAAVLLSGLFLNGLCWADPAFAEPLDFTLHKLGKPGTGHTLLVFGGIQGDEPGGFNAASLLVSNYEITSGSVWVVPNLNFISIIKRSRGVYGDLNRKFSRLAANDPDYRTIKKVKSLILSPEVDAILNLHDGSGFYRPVRQDRMHAPHRWGQSVIIDQDALPGHPFGNLQALARHAADAANLRLYDEEHRVHVKNTHTRKGDVEMEKTLTYFAIRNGKPAYGIEASKSFPTHLRSYYHLLMVESFLRKMGIGFKRRFPLTAQGVRTAINSNVALALYDNKIFLDLRNARNHLNYIPIKKNAKIAFTPSNPLMAVVGSPGSYRVFYGNRRITRLDPEYLEFDQELTGVNMVVDGRERAARFGDVVGVNEEFQVSPPPGYRVNVIGFQATQHNEADLPIRHEDIMPRFSVDRRANIFRVEVYRQHKFAGMVLVDFGGPHMEARNHFVHSRHGLDQAVPMRSLGPYPHSTPPNASR